MTTPVVSDHHDSAWRRAYTYAATLKCQTSTTLQHQDQKPRLRHQGMDAASPDDTLVTEKALETDQEDIPASIHDLHQHGHAAAHTPTTYQATDTTIPHAQDQSPAQRISTLQRRIDSEDARHSHLISTLHRRIHSEQQRHMTRDSTLRQKLGAALGGAKGSRDAPAKAAYADVAREPSLARKKSYVAKWLEGLMSVTTVTPAVESSDDDDDESSVEVVAAKDAKGRGKGIRIVSDGVEETAAVDRDVGGSDVGQKKRMGTI